MRKQAKRKGDTLVEVALAIGIFSMVAIAVVSVISSSTSSAQSALETTVTRESIDVQAEALRFIQNAYISSGEKTNSSAGFSGVWNKIKTLAASNNKESVISYAPSTCDEIYSGDNLKNQKAFIIDTHKMRGQKASEIVLTTSSAVFAPASTYPRLVYSSLGNLDDSILAQDSVMSTTKLQRVEGIYIVAVKDSKNTNIVTNGSVSKPGSSYYDFYIRTCWYTPGAETPSTISTVIRLYDPDV